MAKLITVPAVVASIDTITAFVEEELELHECPMKTVIQINVAIDEIFSNIANYAYGDAEGDVTLTVDFSDEQNKVTLTFEDSGMPYNPLEKSDPDISLSAEEREIGGLGIFIVKKSMDEIAYKYEDGKNIFTISKNF